MITHARGAGTHGDRGWMTRNSARGASHGTGAMVMNRRGRKPIAGVTSAGIAGRAVGKISPRFAQSAKAAIGTVV